MAVSVCCVVMFVLVSRTCAVSAYPHWPREGCTQQDAQRLTCHVVLPHTVPPGINEVVLQKLASSQLHRTDCAFCDRSWATVEKLTIANDGTVDGTSEDAIKHLEGHQFRGLSNLLSLSLSLSYLSKLLTQRTFVGLEKLTTLDMSDCIQMSTTTIFKFLANATILPKLSRLVLHNINTYGDNNNILTQQMFHKLSNGRNITDVDLSSTRLTCLSNSVGFVLYPLCESLKVLNISKTSLVHSETSVRNQTVDVCNSLDILDISGTQWKQHVPKTDLWIINKIVTLSYTDHPKLRFCENVRTLYAKEVLMAMSDNRINIINSVFNISLESKLKHLDISKNRIRWLDVTIISDYICLEFMDLSHNDMEYVTPKFFQQRTLTSLTELDLSHNMLSQMETNKTELETLFSCLGALTKLNLSHNGMSRIPERMFIQNTKLQVLNISYNKMNRVTFAIATLTELKYMDISANNILYLDSSAINVFNGIYIRQESEGNTHLIVKLHSNPLQCSSCGQLQSVKWFARSAIVVSSDEPYTCEDENNMSKPIDEDTVKYVQYICDRKRTILLATLIPVTSVALIVLTIVYIVKRVKKKRIEDRVDIVKWRIEHDAYDFKFPVFLSYSSNDGDVVLQHLYPELQHQLRAYCRTDRELICIGDHHFRAGHRITDEVERCLELSGLLVVVMSENYCASDWCTDELEQAHQLHKPMLIIVLETVDMQDMQPVLRRQFQNHVRVRFAQAGNGNYEITPDWDNVCFSCLSLLP